MERYLTGEVIVKTEIQKINDKLEKQEIVVRTDDKYPQDIKLETLNPIILESVNVGDEVKAFFNLRGREWTGKYFVSLGVWRVEILKNNQDTKEVVKEVEVSTNDDDDFPF
jgi:hypothetical protein